MMFGMIAMAIVFWDQIGKEEMPDFAMESIRISIPYRGASAEDVELFVTKPVEEQLKGISGLDEVSSTSSYGSSSFRINFEAGTPNLQEKIQEVKDAVDAAEFPSEADDPTYRQFRSSEKAIIDLGFYLEDKEILTVEERAQLQHLVLAFKNKVLNLKEISGVDTSGYLRPELQIRVEPEQLKSYEVSMDQVRSQVVEKHVRRPLGSLQDKGESDVTIVSELDNIEALENVIVSSGFEGQQVKLARVAKVGHGFEKSNTIYKIFGREGVILNLTKSASADILSAQESVVNFVHQFAEDNKDSGLRISMMDDESYDVRNRLEIIGANGLIGFLLIVVVLFLFLDFKSGIWVAMGIPFSLAFTLISAFVLGYTVNNMTLAAIIVVLGVVVDDAIIVAENISRRMTKAGPEGAVEATYNVIHPVIASVLTTCIAFVPLYYFSGRFGLLIKYLPLVIFLMLAASLIESFFILPSHMAHGLPWDRWTKNRGERFAKRRTEITEKIERSYKKLVRSILDQRKYVFSVFLLLLVGSSYLYSNHLKYSMFPREESKDFRVKVVAAEDLNRYEMARKVREVEDVFAKHPHTVGTIAQIGQSRRGGEVRENEATLRVEVVPRGERSVSLNKMFEQWEKEFESLKGFEQIKLFKSRWGSDSGSAIAIEVQENNDVLRAQIADRLQAAMQGVKGLSGVEIERPRTKDEIRMKINTDEASRLSVKYDQLSSVLRSYIEGDILYTLNSGEEEVDVRLTSNTESKDNSEDLLDLTVANTSNYLVPIRQLINVEVGKKPSNIQRVNYKRTTMVYADLEKNTSITPLEIADHLEADVFPKVLKGAPAATLRFRGEVEESRESQSEFGLSILTVLVLIYILLVFLFDSIWTPFLIGAIIPFGVVGATFAFAAHGIEQYGFFAVVGILGMIGVIINDSIVLIDKLKSSMDFTEGSLDKLFDQIAEISSTRLRAVVVTTLTTVAGVFPTAYGIGGYDSMLAEMMMAMGWGLLFGMFITLVLVPCLYSLAVQIKRFAEGATQ
tara:strand:+ start:154873 stop:157935 length:3063 start_codon:yes stop_codon:yes gene_type:complete